MKKRFSKIFLAMLIALAVLMGGLSFGQEKVVAAWATDSKTGFSYVTNEDKTGWEIYSFKAPVGFSGKLVIPASYQGVPVVKIGSYFAYDAIKIKSVIIANGVKDVGSYAFGNNINLTSVSIPSSVLTLGSGVFDNCISLKSVTIKPGLQTIGDYVFSGCNRLTTIALPDTVTSVGQSAFSLCTNLVKVKLSRGLKSIGNYAFYKCGKLNNLVLPESLTNIGENAFSYCKALSSIFIPGSVKYINASTFSYNDSLTSVRIGGGVTIIDELAFSNCVKLSSVELPATLNTIGQSAFAYDGALKQITIPSRVTTIGESAFLDTALSTVTFNGKVRSVGESVFYLPYLSTGRTILFNIPLGTTAYYSSLINSNEVISYSTTPRFEEQFNADGLIAKSATYNSIKLTWARTTGATGYEVSRSTSINGNFSPIANVAGTSYTNRGLKTGTKYYYRIRAYYGTSVKTYSQASTIANASPIPAVPASFKVTRASASSLKITWKKVAGAKGYEVRDNAGRLIKSTTALTFTKEKLKKGTSYYYKVRAYTMVGKTKVYGAYSVIKSAKP